MSNILSLFFKISFLMLLFTVFAQAQEPQWHKPEKAIELGHKTQKPVLIFVSIPNCGWCLKMEKEVLPKLFPKWQNYFVFTHINATDNRTRLHLNGAFFTSLSWAQKLNVKSYPSLVFIRPNGKVFFRLSGFVNSEKLQQILNYLVKMD